MLDEDEYTVLNLRPKIRNTTGPTENEIQDCRVHLHLYKVTVGILGVGSIILISAVIGLSILVFQGPSWKEQAREALNATDCKCTSQKNINEVHGTAHPEDFRSNLKLFLCGLPSSSSAEGLECKLCPLGWLKHRGKCYWLSKETGNWKTSQNNCSINNSQILVIQDQEEMDFIMNIKGGPNLVWIGFSFSTAKKKWTWVNDSHFDENMFKVKGPAQKDSCGAIKGNEIQSEICSAEFRWICKKEGFPV